jgi:endonuclease/exonuclease/phosphatase family metal-dependent hydrolase
MTYNLLNYPGTDTTTRNPYFRTTLSYVNPDILVVQEITSQAGVNGFVNNVLNSYSSYKAGTFIDGYDTDNAIFYKDSAFTFLSNTRITTALRDINQFKLVVNASGDTLNIFSVHLKASQGTEEEAARAAEVDRLRAITDKLSSNANFVVVGDFNLYTSSESAYQKLLSQSSTGYFLDPINKPGNWHNNSAFTSIHTQSPRVEQFGGGSTGGLDDRFDFILISQAVKDEGGIAYINGSYTAVGNDGNHFNKSINVQPNTAVPAAVATALYYSADHLPVYADFSYEETVPVELASFSAVYSNSSINLSWVTATETNNYGFEVERSVNMTDWQQVGFVQSSGNSVETKYYSYSDKEIKGTNVYYRLKIVDLDGSYEYSKVLSVSVPVDFTLYQNYPNPFNAETVIKYSIPYYSLYKITLYDVLGSNVKVLSEGFADAGVYNVHLTDIGLSSGTYFVEMRTDAGIKYIKILLMK